MEILKKYWVVIAIVVAIGIGWFLTMKKKKADEAAKPTGCQTTLEQWKAKMVEVEKDIDTVPEWRKQVEDNAVEKGTSYEVARKLNAAHFIVVNRKICKPALAA